MSGNGNAAWTRWVIGILIALAMASSGMAIGQSFAAERAAVAKHDADLTAHATRARAQGEKQDERIDKLADIVGRLATEQAVTNERLKRIADRLDKGRGR